MSPPPSSPEHVCFYWHPGSDVSVFVWVMDVSTECRWHCQLLPTTHMPPTHHSSPQTACLTAQKSTKHTHVFTFCFLSRESSSAADWASEVRGHSWCTDWKAELLLKLSATLKNTRGEVQEKYRSVRPGEHRWDSKEISIPTFFVRLRRDLTRRNRLLQTIIVAEPRYDVTGEKQDSKNRI